SGTQQLTTADNSVLTFAKTDVNNTLLTLPGHNLVTGQAIEYATTGNVIGGLSNHTTYYAIVVNANQIELADSVEHAFAGEALSLQVGAGTGTQTLTASSAILAVSAAAALSAAGALGAGVAIAGAGADATNVILGKDNAYISGSTVTSAGGVGITTQDMS